MHRFRGGPEWHSYLSGAPCFPSLRSRPSSPPGYLPLTRNCPENVTIITKTHNTHTNCAWISAGFTSNLQHFRFFFSQALPSPIIFFYSFLLPKQNLLVNLDSLEWVSIDILNLDISNLLLILKEKSLSYLKAVKVDIINIFIGKSIHNLRKQLTLNMTLTFFRCSYMYLNWHP